MNNLNGDIDYYVLANDDNGNHWNATLFQAFHWLFEQES